MDYRIERGVEWLLGGNDLDICYTERQNGGDYKSPICWDLTGADYKEIVLSPEFLTLLTLGIGIILLFIMIFRVKKRADSRNSRKL